LVEEMVWGRSGARPFLVAMMTKKYVAWRTTGENTPLNIKFIEEMIEK